MNVTACKELIATPVSLMRLLAQDVIEWFHFLEFCEKHFKEAGVSNPVVVEIGVMRNAQKIFYTTLLGADHIGIDMNPNSGADIIGDSHDKGTRQELARALEGRKIDLLFIDGDHSYAAVKRDYEMYDPMTRHIVALHDIAATVNSDVGRFWHELRWGSNRHMCVAINRHNDRAVIERNKFIDMGIGLIIKRREK